MASVDPVEAALAALLAMALANLILTLLKGR